MNSSPHERIFLLVEDNPDDVFLMSRVFKKEKIEGILDVVTDGKQAIEYLERKDKLRNDGQTKVPELIFLDLKLPFLNGFDVLDWIRRQPGLISLPVVVLTSSLEDQDRERADCFGVPYFVKPPTAQLLRDALRFAASGSNM